MIAGALRHKLVIQKPATTVARGTGGEDLGTPWETHAEVYGALEPLRGRERQAAQKILDATSVKFRIRYEADVKPEMRIVYRQIPFYINSVLDIDRRKIELLIHALVQEQGAYFPTINISNVGATGGDAFYVVITYDTDQEGSTKVRYKEDGGSWLYTDEADISPRVFSHSETIGPLDGEKNYLADVWTEDHFGQTDGYEGSLTWGIDTDGSYLADGYSPLEITDGPTTPGAHIGQSVVRILWTTNTAAYHRARYKGQGNGGYITTSWSGSPSTDANVYVAGIACTYEIHEYQVQSCLVGDGSQATDWTPETPNTFDMVRVNDIILSNFDAYKQAFPPPGSTWVKCDATDNYDKATNVKIKTRWKEEGGGWTEHPNFN